MKPELHIGGVTLQTFGIAFALAFLFAGFLVAKRLKELDYDPEWAYEIVFFALVGGLVGARVDYLIQNWSKVSDDFFGNLFSGSGLVWLGGMVGGTLGVLLWAWRRKFLNLTLLDVCAPALAIGYACGRVGCQLSGDGDYGIKSGLPWAMSYPHGTVPTEDKVHPTPVYETLAMGIFALVLWHLRDRYRPGVLFAIYLVGAGVERFLIELIRRNDSVIAGLTLPQLLSLAMAAAGLIWLARARSRGGLELPAASAAA